MGGSSRKLLAAAVASAPASSLPLLLDEKSVADFVNLFVSYGLLVLLFLMVCYLSQKRWAPTQRDPAEDEEDELVIRFLQARAPPVVLGRSWTMFSNLSASAATRDYLQEETEEERERVRGYLEAMPAVVHAAAAAEDVCSICLGEYEDGEEVRLLEKCNHKYHKNCIDPWLILRGKSCPVCREVVIPL